MLNISGNTIVSAALEGIAESFILQTNDDGTAVAQQTFACEDVTVAENQISNCLLGAAEAKVPASAAVLFPIVERFKVLRNTIDGTGQVLRRRASSPRSRSAVRSARTASCKMVRVRR